MTAINCGCGDYGIEVSDYEPIYTFGVVCPECGNHFGFGAPDEMETGTETYQSAYDEKIESIAVVLDEFPPMQILDAIQKLADDPDSLMHSGEVLTAASNLSTDEEMERKIGLSETDGSSSDYSEGQT